MIGMFLLTGSLSRRFPAHSPYGCRMRFDSGRVADSLALRMVSPRNTSVRDSKNRYPSPSTRLGLPQAEPQLFWGRQRFAASRGLGRSGLRHTGPRAIVWSMLSKGGCRPCENPYLSLRSYQSSGFRPAETHSVNRPLSAQALVRERPLCSIKTPLQARPSVVARTSFTARTTRGRADTPNLTAPKAGDGNSLDAGPAYGEARVFFVSKQPGWPARESACSRKS